MRDQASQTRLRAVPAADRIHHDGIDLVVGEINPGVFTDRIVQRGFLTDAEGTVKPCLNGFERREPAESFYPLLVRHLRVVWLNRGRTAPRRVAA